MTAPEKLELAELQDAVLDDATFDQLIDDIESCTQVLEVRAKQGARSHADDQPQNLRQGASDLRSGKIRGLQVCYLHEGQEWWDTLIATGEGVRLVRVRRGAAG